MSEIMADSSNDLLAQNVAAVQAAIRDMENGDAGRPATAVIEELREELAGQRECRPID
jgi:hypothetical protein